MCSRTCELVESVAPYPKTSTEELNQSGCHKRCPRGVPEAKQSCLHDLFGFFYQCRCHEPVSLLNLLHRIPEELNQSGCHKRCPRGVPEASQGGVEPTGGGALHMKFSRDAAISRIPAPHLLKQGQLQLAGASFREKSGRLKQPTSAAGSFSPSLSCSRAPSIALAKWFLFVFTLVSPHRREGCNAPCEA